MPRRNMWRSPWGTSQRTRNSKVPVRSHRGVSQGTPRISFSVTPALDPCTELRPVEGPPSVGAVPQPRRGVFRWRVPPRLPLSEHHRTA
jgi:hypothetical protein